MTNESKPYAILLGHDDDAIREHLLRALRKDAFAQVAVVESGRDAIDALTRTEFDILIASIALPDIDIWRLSRMVRSGDFCSSQLPVAVLTTKNGSFNVEVLAEQDAVFVLDPNEDDRVVRDHVAGLIEQRIRPRVLIIEDDPKQAAAVALALQHTYRTEIRHDGHSGLQCWLAERHDLILLDLMLPTLAGSQVLEKIVAVDRGQPVVVVTAHGSRATHVALMLNGAAYFIEKPLDLDHLRETCALALRHKGLVNAYRRSDATDSLLEHLSTRIIAANHSMDQGRTQSTHHHLRNALARCVRNPLSEDDWAAIVAEFD